MPTVKVVVTGRWEENCYVVEDGHGGGVVIDPGEGGALIDEAIASAKVRITGILATHAHYDHVGAVSELAERHQAPFHLHGGDFKLLRQVNLYRNLFDGNRAISIPRVDCDLSEVSCVTLGGLEIQVLPCAGHTPGGVSFLIEDCLFSGDLVLGGRVGRTDLPGGDREALVASIRRIFDLPSETRVYPGHGAPTTLGAIRQCSSDVAALLA